MPRRPTVSVQGERNAAEGTGFGTRSARYARAENPLNTRGVMTPGSHAYVFDRFEKARMSDREE